MNKTETKSTVLLKHHLKALKLPTMHAECEKIAERCGRGQCRSSGVPAATLRVGTDRTRTQGGRTAVEGGPFPRPQAARRVRLPGPPQRQ